MSVWVLLIAMMNHSASCQTVNGERILGADLSKALPSFSSIPADEIIGYSPAPGLRRVFQYAELTRLGRKFRIEVPAEAQACFERQLRPVEEEAVRSVIRESLRSPQARVEILAMSREPAPEGRLVFPVTGLSVATAIDPQTPVIWRGYVLYDKNWKFALWARVRISATMTRVVAVQPLPPGETVQAHQVRLESYEDFPLRSDVARNLEEVVGRVPKRTIREKLPILKGDLTEPLQVKRGELVEVTAVAGTAQLRLEAVAETSGRQGEVISLKNPSSGKTFRGRIEGKGKALVMAHGL